MTRQIKPSETQKNPIHFFKVVMCQISYIKLKYQSSIMTNARTCLFDRVTRKLFVNLSSVLDTIMAKRIHVK